MTTKDEFVAKIREAGKGMPIDISKISTKPQYNTWFYVAGVDGLDFGDGTRQVIISYIMEVNPPEEWAIYFLEGEGDERFVATVPDSFADFAIGNLTYKDPFMSPSASIKQKAMLSHSGKEALYALQRDREGVEWGGGIDFEIINNQPRVERILTYYGEEHKIPSRIIRKYGNDVEVQFHTHPNCKFAEPSDNDINQFINIEQRVCFIIADDEILVREKTRNTPKSTNIDEVKSECPSTHYQGTNKSEQMKAINEIEKKFAIRTAIIPRKANLVFDLNIIRNLQ